MSKSGIIGLLAAALGRPRDADLGELAALRVAVRVDRPGRRERDFQTALHVAKADGATGDTVTSVRHYLADASFLVGVEGPQGLLQSAHAALRRPRWPLFLGRQGYVPSVPPYVPDGFINDSALAALQHHRWPTEQTKLLAYVESTSDEGGHLVHDVPLSFAQNRRLYGPRWVRPLWLESAG